MTDDVVAAVDTPISITSGGAALGKPLRRMAGAKRSPLLRGAMGIVATVAAWEVLAVTWLAPRHLAPTPTSVVATFLHHPQLAVWPNLVQTVEEAALGWLIGNTVGIVMAVIFVQIPVVEAALLRVALASYCMPVIAIGPILDIVFAGVAPKAALAALSVVFITLIGAMVGLRSADQASLDIVRAYGGGSWTMLAKVRARSALPSTFTALRIAAPAAVLGAVVGEYLGGNKGLGVAMINSEQALEVSQTWAIAFIVTAVGGLGYLATSIVGRRLTPWATESLAPAAAAADLERRLNMVPRRAIFLRMVRASLFFAVSIGVAIGIWQGFIDLFHLNPFFAKGPSDVWGYLFNAQGAAQNRQQLLDALVTTARDAGLGYLSGTAVAVAIAVAVVLSTTVEHTVMPIAMVLRSVPLVAMAPLLILLFGTGLLGVTVIAGIVTFFPTLVNMVFGLRSPPRYAVDLVTVYGGGSASLLSKVRVPYALPALFASARIAAPAALLGAVVAEWLATGQGLGYEMVQAADSSQFDFLWAGVVVITVFAFLVYNLVAVIERPVLSRFAGW